MKPNPFLRAFTLVLIAFGLFCAAVWFWYLRNPLKRYGVFFVETSGMSESLNHVQFYMDHQGARRNGPRITGTWLFVDYDDINNDGVLEIFVKSRADKSHRVILKLNLSGDSKVPFEIVEHSLGVSYPELGLYCP